MLRLTRSWMCSVQRVHSWCRPSPSPTAEPPILCLTLFGIRQRWDGLQRSLGRVPAHNGAATCCTLLLRWDPTRKMSPLSMDPSAWAADGPLLETLRIGRTHLDARCSLSPLYLLSRYRAAGAGTLPAVAGSRGTSSRAGWARRTTPHVRL